MSSQKSVLITGANRGLGLELVKVFAQNGWQVIATARNTKELVAQISSIDNVQALPLDISGQKSIDNLVSNLEGKGLDVLINNAGIYDDDIETLEEATKVFQTNIIGPRILAESLVKNLELGREKLVVSISSGMSRHVGLSSYNAHHWPYSASKAALNFAMIGFTLRHPKLKSVLVNPGWMQTDMGGEGADIHPKESAEKIFSLIENKKMPTGKLIDTNGRVLSV